MESSGISSTYNTAEEKRLIEAAQGGSREAIESLVKRHQPFIYNVALKLVQDPQDAADLTQEALLKMLTKLTQFRFNSNFKTWLYSIVFNHFQSSKRRKPEKDVQSFTALGKMADELYNELDMSLAEQKVHAEEISFVRNKCMTSALLCLDRQQRMVLILGFIFQLPSAEAAPLLDLTAVNFRKLLQRAKEDLFEFMDNKCGLMNAANPCRCHKKAKGFMAEGLLDEQQVRFESSFVQTIQDAVGQKNAALDELMEGKYLRLFVEQPFAEPFDKAALVKEILVDPEIRTIYRL